MFLFQQRVWEFKEFFFTQNEMHFVCSGDTSPQYSAHPEGMGHPQSFGGTPRSPQTEPVDFSGPPRPVGFGLVYSRESTPDSGASHYMESYRDPSGK